ncbi:MAG: hypothetical protein JSW04_03845 [Desulfobacterales bacterium]|nr:MAG: hypothetical protein JSW04_03845 [Desulfobacterales bacterium]
MKDFVGKMIKEHALNLVMVGYCTDLEDLKAYDTEQYDIALVIDGNHVDMKTVSKDTGVLPDKLLQLW